MSDLIDRQAAIDALDVLCQEHRYKIPGKGETYSQYNEGWNDAIDRAEGAIFNLPSAEPELPIKQKCYICPHCDNCDVNDDGTIEPMKGKWIDALDEDPCYYRCSECGRLSDFLENFCPECGADMRGEEDDHTAEEKTV